MPNPVVHFEIMGVDGAKLQQFYADLFGWTIDASNPMKYGVVDTGVEHAIGGGVGSTETGKPASVFYVEVDDPQAYLDRAVSTGATVVAPVTEIPNMVTFAQFADPEGNVIGIVKAQPTP